MAFFSETLGNEVARMGICEKRDWRTDGEPQVSVVIPVYNAEKTLPACLDSVFAQTYAQYEVILVDDGSKDGSAAICKAYAEKHPGRVCYVKQENSGPASARNTGIELSRGKYIAFADADDRLAETMLAVMTEKAESHGAEMVICAYWTVSRSGTSESTYGIPEGLYTGEGLRTVLASALQEKSGDIPPYSWTRLTRRSVFEENGLRFQDGLIRSEDFHMWVRVQARLKSVYILSRTPLYYYVETGSSITHRHVEGYWKDVLFIYRDLKEKLPDDETTRTALDLMLVKRALIALGNASRCASAAEAGREIKEITENELLFHTVRSLEGKEPARFKRFRFLMKHRLKALIRLKYLSRFARNRA